MQASSSCSRALCRASAAGGAARGRGDAAALAGADDLLAFLAAADGGAVSERHPTNIRFEAFVAARRRLVALELIGVTVGNARRGRASPRAFAIAFEPYARNGPRFEARLARAYASRVIPTALAARPAVPAFD